ncbi:Type 3 secretion system secretin [Usitatibacter rugosus]|uniref:Type 3 secretion system secretin n=1 Tax=Usitatibacter rugosus TaxID=2732067 RepID=A0A6M4GT57_9PROT|nr:type II secretion system protein GspD [Usitatibacter rugosus]QJR10441.1 Type 3 secretion system secretin [Usitatibacter rugosus]
MSAACAFAQSPGGPSLLNRLLSQQSQPPASPAPVPAASPRGNYVVAEPTSGLPPGRLIPLPVMAEGQVRELEEDLSTHLEVTLGYVRLPAAQVAQLPAFPPAVVPALTLAKGPASRREFVRIGHLSSPRRLPQLWIQGFVSEASAARPNHDIDAPALDNALKMILAERTRIFARLRLADLATKTLPLSYVDSEAALFALRAMGYAVVTDSESLSRDDSYKGDDVDAFELARPSQAATAPTSAGAEGGSPFGGGTASALSTLQPDQQNRFLPRFPAIRNLPTTIALDRLPLVVKIPSTDKTNMGLVGGEHAPAGRDQLGLTIIPNAASPLSETVTGGSSELLVIYHPQYPEQLAKVSRLINDTIDRPARQVYVEGLVLEISQDGLKELGVQWDLKSGSSVLSLGSLIPVPPGGNALSYLYDRNANVSPTQLIARINALVQTNKAQVLSRPSIITLDNRQATIRVGTDIPVATSTDASGTGSGSNRVAFSFQYIPTGILLNVRPRISDDQSEISMLIDATVSATVPGQDLQVLDPATKIALASAPTISTRRVQTYARILDNQSLIIGGLLSRNQVTKRSKTPLLGDIPFVGAFFSHTSTEDDRREVIIVLTPSVVTENIRETKAQYPKDDDRFDQVNTELFKSHYRLRAEDLIDSSDFRFNARFRAYRDAANRAIERKPELATRAPFPQFAGTRVPGEFFFLSGTVYRMLDRMDAGDPIRVENLKFFERSPGGDLRPASVAQALARYGDGTDPASFFARNPGKALAMTFRLSRTSLAPGDSFTETIPEIRLVDCADRATWRQQLWELSKPDAAGVARFTVLIQDPSDLRRLQLAYATQNTILNNGGTGAMVFDRWLVGRMVHLQEVSPSWERVMNAQIAQYFFLGEHYYMYFMQEHEKALGNLEVALRAPEMQPLLEGVKLP